MLSFPTADTDDGGSDMLRIRQSRSDGSFRTQDGRYFQDVEHGPDASALGMDDKWYVVESPWGVSRSPFWLPEGLQWVYRRLPERMLRQHARRPVVISHPCWSEDLRVSREATAPLGIYAKLVLRNADVHYEVQLAGPVGMVFRRWELWRHLDEGVTKVAWAPFYSRDVRLLTDGQMDEFVAFLVVAHQMPYSLFVLGGHNPI